MTATKPAGGCPSAPAGREATPEAGAVIKDTGGLRKLRQPDTRRGKGKRGGLRIIGDKELQAMVQHVLTSGITRRARVHWPHGLHH